MADNKNIFKRAQEAFENPELDDTQKALERIKDWSDKERVASQLQEARTVFEREVQTLDLSPEERAKALADFAKSCDAASADLQKRAISGSREGLKLDTFATSFLGKFKDDHKSLEEAISRRKAENSQDLVKVIVRSGVPLLAAGIMQYLAGEKEGEEDEGGQEEEEKAEIEGYPATPEPNKDESPSGETPSGTPGTTGRDEIIGGSKGQGAPAPSRFEGKVESSGSAPIKYEFKAGKIDKLTPEQFRKAYETEDRFKRYQLVLEQVAAGNLDTKFTTLKVTAKETGSTLEMQVGTSRLRVGGMEVTLDGPTSLAAAHLAGCTLPTPWIVDRIWDRAKESGGALSFFGAKQLDPKDWEDSAFPGHPNGRKMLGAEWAIKHAEMAEEYRKKLGDQLMVGHFKEVVLPGAGTKRGMLNMYRPPFQGSENNAHEETYGDYSHGPRFIYGKVKITRGGKTEEMDFEKFFSDPKNAKEFGFPPIDPKKTYALSPEQKKFLAEHGIKPEGEKKEDKGSAPTAVAATDKDKNKDKAKKTA